MTPERPRRKAHRKHAFLRRRGSPWKAVPAGPRPKIRPTVKRNTSPQGNRDSEGPEEYIGKLGGRPTVPPPFHLFGRLSFRLRMKPAEPAENTISPPPPRPITLALAPSETEGRTASPTPSPAPWGRPETAPPPPNTPISIIVPHPLRVSSCRAENKRPTTGIRRPGPPRNHDGALRGLAH